MKMRTAENWLMGGAIALVIALMALIVYAMTL